METLALLRDFPEENWPSMDVVADGLLAGATALNHLPLRVTPVCAQFRHRAAWLARSGAARNVDRLWNRMVVYPRYASTISRKFDFFHVVDHSYSHLIHQLPAERTGVYCHDLDTFRCILDPAAEPRPKWFRVMASRILTGMQAAAVVFHSTDEIRTRILDRQLVDERKLVKAPHGVAAQFRPASENDTVDELSIAELKNCPFLLHVGSCIPRKRIDVLLEVFAAVRREMPELMLLKIGGEWTAAQLEQIEMHNLADAIVHRPLIERSQIAAAYRAALVTLVTSEAEGFGLPVIEALACGSSVIASDIPVLREVGGDAVVYAALANINVWREQVLQTVRNPDSAPSLKTRLARASHFTWKRHAEIIIGAYRSIS